MRSSSVYFREIIEKELTLKKARLKGLGDEVVSMHKEIVSKYEQLKKSKPADANSESAGLLQPALLIGQVMRYQDLLSNIDANLRLLEQEKLAAERRLQNPEAEVAPPPAGLVEPIEKDPALAKELAKLETREKYLAKLNKDNPEIDRLAKEIKALREKHDKHNEEKLAEYRKSQLPGIEKKLKAELEQRKVNLFNARAQREQIEKTTKEYQSKLATSDTSKTPQSITEMDIKEREKILGSMLEKQKRLNLEINAPARVTEFQTAAVPQKKDMKKQIIATVVAGMMGFGLVGLMAVVYESRVKRRHVAGRCATVGSRSRAGSHPLCPAPVPAIESRKRSPSCTVQCRNNLPDPNPGSSC